MIARWRLRTRSLIRLWMLRRCLMPSGSWTVWPVAKVSCLRSLATCTTSSPRRRRRMGEYELAARLEAKALETGCEQAFPGARDARLVPAQGGRHG